MARSGNIKIRATQTIDATLLDIVQRLEVYVRVMKGIKHFLPRVAGGSHASAYIEPGGERAELRLNLRKAKRKKKEGP